MAANISTLDNGSKRFLALRPELTNANTFARALTHPTTGQPMTVKVWWMTAADAAGLYVDRINADDIARVLDQSLTKVQNTAILDADSFYDRIIEAADILRANARNGTTPDADMMNAMLGLVPVDSFSWIGTDPSSGRRYPVHATAGEGHTNFSAERFAWFCGEVERIYSGRVEAVGNLGQLPTVAFATIGIPQVADDQAWKGLGLQPFLIVADGYRSNRRFGVTATYQRTHCANTIPARGLANVAITHNANGEINMVKVLDQMERAVLALDTERSKVERMVYTKTRLAKLLDGDKDVTVVDPRDGVRKPFPGLAPVLKGDAAKKKGAETVRDRLRESLQWTLQNLVTATKGQSISAFDAWMVGDSYDQWVRQSRERNGYKQPLADRQGMDLLTGTGGDMAPLARAYADSLVGSN